MNQSRPTRRLVIAGRSRPQGMQTDLSNRKYQINEIVRLYDLDNESDRVLRQQLDSLTNLGIDVVYRLALRR